STLWGPSTIRVEHVADLTSHGGVWAAVTIGGQANGGPYEVPWLMAMRVANGRISSLDIYDEHDVDAARGTLAPTEPFANTAWRATVRHRDACNRRDLQGLID